MTSRPLRENLVRHAPESTTKLLELLFDGLDWPSGARAVEDIPLLPWSPEELHLDSAHIAKLTKIQQLPKLTSEQPFGVFLLTFAGGQLPVGAVRRVVNSLVRKQRAQQRQARALWHLQDLLFFCQSSEGVKTLHIVAFRETAGVPTLKVISWDNQATDNRIELLAREALPSLTWPGEQHNLEQWREQWTAAFSVGYRQGLRTAAALASRMAEVGRSVRNEVTALYEVETEDGPLRTMLQEVRRSLWADLTPEQFADMYAQTMVYGLLTARITHPEDFAADALSATLRFENPFLDALYASFRRQADATFDLDEFGIHELAELLAATDVGEILADFGTDSRKDDPVVFFYEEFLEQYDPEQRRELGTYYTPIPVVRFMVRAVDEIIKRDFDLPLGVADQTSWGDYSARSGIEIPSGLKASDPVIRMVDPATGTGTYLLEWMRQAFRNLKAADQLHASSQLGVLAQMDAFEISLSAYAVAHLKTSLELPSELRAQAHLGIRLADTLAGRAPDQTNLFGEDPIAEEGLRADRTKFDTHHSVVIGNPPYSRVESAAAGGWISHPPNGGRSLFDDIHEPARQLTNFAHHASLYNLYVYFWRWAIWKAFEQTSEGPGIVSFITASSWLKGPGFIGLRALARQHASHIYVVDLGGDGLLAEVDENVFPIQTPVAIVFIVRSPKSRDTEVSYIRILGTREHKLMSLERGSLTGLAWAEGPSAPHATFVSHDPDSEWQGFPLLSDLFPWQQPGCKFGRTWPTAPLQALLIARWKKLVGTADLEQRAAAFVTGSSGRNIMTRVSGLERLADLKADAKHMPIMRYAYRSFDRQWALFDPRLAKTESPSLWASLSPRQVFMTSLMSFPISGGPAATVTASVPDMAVYRGSFGGKDIIPLYRDVSGTPNCDPALLRAVEVGFAESGMTGEPLSAEALFAYSYGVLAGSDYSDRFAADLRTPGPRVPVTANRELFDRMSVHGEYLIWLHTFGERFHSEANSCFEPDPAIFWDPAPSRPPTDSRDFAFDPFTQSLRVADGVLKGISSAVWDLQVSGMPVISKWLGYRTVKGAGRAASSNSPLDKIRPTTWPDEWSTELREVVHALKETLAAQETGAELLSEILAGPLISADELPQPPASLRAVPATASGDSQPAEGQLDI